MFGEIEVSLNKPYSKSVRCITDKGLCYAINKNDLYTIKSNDKSWSTIKMKNASEQRIFTKMIKGNCDYSK